MDGVRIGGGGIYIVERKCSRATMRLSISATSGQPWLSPSSVPAQ